MVVSELVRAELRRVDWASLKCGRGESAEHVPLLIEAVITAETARDMIGYTLDGHVEESTVIFECTPPAVGVSMAALAGDLSTPARDALLQTLSFVAAGSGDYGPIAEGTSLGEGCRHHAREGFWRLSRSGSRVLRKTPKRSPTSVSTSNWAVTKPPSTRPGFANACVRRPGAGDASDAAKITVVARGRGGVGRRRNTAL